MKSVLIISGTGDAHAEHMREILAYKEIPHLLFLTNNYPFESQLTFDFYNNYVLTFEDRQIVINTDWSIWNRRIFPPNFPKDFPENLEDMVIEESKRTLQGLMVTHKGLIVNNPFNNYRANNKIEQLQHARKRGLKVPDTIITNDTVKAKEFYQKHNGNIIFKMQKLPIIKDENEVHKTIMTTRVLPEHLDNFRRVENSPCFFQELIEKEYEIRITVIGEKLFPIAIYSQSSEISRDDFRRYDFEKVKYGLVEIPQNISKKVVDLTYSYKLHYAGIDLIYTPKGEYIFLEINPNGQYLWTEEMSGVKITDFFADYLAQLKGNPKLF